MSTQKRPPHLYCEYLVSPQLLAKWVPGPTPYSPSQEYLEARDALFERITANIPNILTTKQLACLSLFITGMYTQQEIGDELNLAQTTVHKTIHGNIHYPKNGGPPRRQGGALQSIRVWASKDKETQDLLALLKELS